jgi:parvulin-like peptidyl-prolyl isomerase
VSDFFKKPAVHVLILGVLVAAAILVVRGPSTGDETRRVVITGSDLLQLRAAFVRTWQREPTAEELRGALEQHIRQEVLYREALARGYDRDDPVVRRAMQQKMEFLAASQALREQPTEEEIEAFFSLRKERYRLPAVVTFAQVYVSPDVRGAAAEADANQLLDRLRREDPGPAELVEWGDPIMLEPVYRDASEREISSTFGKAFAERIVSLTPNSWEGPISSGYGLHLVKVLDRIDSRVPEWREVSGRVINDMEFEARASARDQLYQEIAQNYQIVLDGQVRNLVRPAE